MNLSLRLSSISMTGLLLVGCGGGSTADSGVDSSVSDITTSDASDVRDVASDSVDAVDVVAADVVDAMTVSDAAVDAVVDAAVDAAVDASVDASVDAAVDAASDVVMNDAGPAWACLGTLTPDPSSAGTLTLTFNVNDYSNGLMPLPGVTVKACPRSEITCAIPDGSGTTDSSNTVHFILTVPATGWDGYFELTGGGVYPTRYFPVAPLTTLTTSASTGVLTTTEVDALSGAAGVTLDPARGQISSNTFDCMLNTQAGVVLSMMPASTGSVQFYLDGGVPSTTATATDSSGVAGFFNVQPGTETVTATVVGDWIGAITLSVRAGFMSTFGMRPLPRM